VRTDEDLADREIPDAAEEVDGLSWIRSPTVVSRQSWVILDGTLIPIDRVTGDRPQYR